MKKSIYIFIGTSAELIKMAPVIKEFQKKKMSFKLITTGQNQILFSDMSKYLGNVKPDIAFEEKNRQSSSLGFFYWSVKTFFLCLFSLRNEFRGLNKKNSYFIVHGDTVSSLMGAFIARIYGLKLVHIESGLRSFNFSEPFPEEICRYLVSRLADIHFCPNKWAVQNLKHLKSDIVNTKQNTLYDSYKMTLNYKKIPAILKTIKKKYFILVVHRQEHVIFGKNKTKALVETVKNNIPKDFQCVLIMHALTQGFFESEDPRLFKSLKRKSVIIPRLPYPEFMKLLDKSEYIITDGGSNQEESYYMGKPCLLLRNHTERMEGLNSNAVLSKGNKEEIVNFVKNYKNYSQKKLRTNVRPAKIIVDYLTKIK